MEFPKRLSELRKEKNWTQEDLAEQLYVSRQTISNWERGVTFPDINSLILISECFDTSIDYLLKGDLSAMKEATETNKKKLKQIIIYFYLAFLTFSVLYPARFLDKDSITVAITLSLVVLVYVGFQLYHILAVNQLHTFTVLLNYIDAQERKQTYFKEFIFSLAFLAISFLTFFIGTILSALIFY